eukprot:Opistho-2@62407
MLVISSLPRAVWQLYGAVTRATVHLPAMACRRMSTAQPNAVLVERTVDARGVVRLVLNDPSRRNALSLDMIRQLDGHLQAAAQDAKVRAVVISARGPAFSSGHNLRELTAECAADHARVFAACSDVMKRVQEIPIPVIAAVGDQLATAAGCQLVASCDIVVASRRAHFATPGVRIGLFCSTPAVALARAVPSKAALEMLLTGEAITADDALRCGLVSRVVDGDASAVDAAVERIVGLICDASRSVIALGKAGYYRQLAMPRDQAYSLAESVIVSNLSDVSDGKEGIDAFLQKRKPKWSN